jgi:hypothetical protein
MQGMNCGIPGREDGHIVIIASIDLMCWNTSRIIITATDENVQQSYPCFPVSSFLNTVVFLSSRGN